MKKAFERYEEARRNADAADTAWENNPESAECEKAFDEAYKEEYSAFTSLVNEIVKFTDNKIDTKTASAMVRAKYNELKKLLEAVA